MIFMACSTFVSRIRVIRALICPSIVTDVREHFGRVTACHKHYRCCRPKCTRHCSEVLLWVFKLRTTFINKQTTTDGYKTNINKCCKFLFLFLFTAMMCHFCHTHVTTSSSSTHHHQWPQQPQNRQQQPQKQHKDYHQQPQPPQPQPATLVQPQGPKRHMSCCLGPRWVIFYLFVFFLKY